MDAVKEPVGLKNFVPDETSFTTPRHQSPITKVRYIEITFGETTETFRATRFYEQAAIQSAKERFIHRHFVKMMDQSKITYKVVDYNPETKFTIV